MSWFEDLKIGETRDLGTYTFTEENITRFARSFDPQPFHLSDAAARETHFGALCASGWHTAAVWMKLLVASVKAEAEDLEKKITDLDRKVEITTMTARRVRNATRTLGMHNTSSVASPGGRSLTGSRRGTSGLGAYTLRSP